MKNVFQWLHILTNTGVKVFSPRKLVSLASFRQTVGFARLISKLSSRGAYKIFGNLRVGAYLRWLLIRGWALIKFLNLERRRLFEVVANSWMGAY